MQAGSDISVCCNGCNAPYLFEKESSSLSEGQESTLNDAGMLREYMGSSPAPHRGIVFARTAAASP